ncbi:Phage protein D [Streptoalloteichus tenebrarius]|uniref:Phage protein D n=1 Tax=Streptoalloteichus tenebrarius (strain ATCC 17920 / DSM 40477 / JCM 4838 / CBS 697.72 / NBRC 16177 / NCIMB 11028 / NRRL B-12390 / A12253. 1 / ISP 5477) TaxID=1933 RepID=A0ABT1HNT9_STRSD|nr:contractile injection system protein, VgrG/Pvc8 family [Streptoalloteichus tenebrarius]MCP2257177.1 Phage protein D [Streptoalloteichus tenebrarius]BFE98811.1 phage late control D family protein [Streptoalloteichus tenebrarius]
MTSSAQPIYPGQDFYVPTFEVNPPGRRMARDVLHDVIDVSYADGISQIDSFTFTVNNWDARTRAFKYSDGATFLPGRKLELWMGYRGGAGLRRLMTGEITSLRPSFPATGQPTLAVTALNVLHRFRDRQQTVVYEKKTDSQIAKQIGDRLGVQVHTAPRNEQPYPYLLQDNEYDIVFLLDRARRIGYDLWVEEEQRSGRSVLHFEPSAALRRVAYRLTWGKSLLEFEPTLTIARQVNQVVVHAWDRRLKKKIKATARRADIGGHADQEVERAFAQRAEVTSVVVANEQEANRIAQDRLRDIAHDMIQASGSTVGLPDLRAGSKLRIDGLGRRFDGTYFATGTRHVQNDSGYRTSFECRRES